MKGTPIQLLVLNHNGLALLEECLPSIVQAARQSRHRCEVLVVDNGSTDGSLAWLAVECPQVGVVRLPNRGLCSFNAVLSTLPGRVAVLLNNDIKLARDAIDPLVEPLLQAAPAGDARPVFLTAPQCWLFDGRTYEGFRTAVRFRAGLVRATALFTGHASGIEKAGPTASAGAAMAVDREKFLELGGFDPVYFPGRIEDLDLCYRAWQAGYECRYVPESVAYHRGQATFGPTFGEAECLRLALRNTLLFQWKNLSRPAHIVAQLVWLPLRIVSDVGRAPFVARERRFLFSRAFASALSKVRQTRKDALAPPDAARERDWFREFAPRKLVRDARPAEVLRLENIERRRAAGYPISRFCWRPLAGWLAGKLAATRVRPRLVTVAGLAATALAAVLGALGPAAGASLLAWAALMWILAWFCDRLDGQLARRQGLASKGGAWLDANIDELGDVALRGALAWGAARAAEAVWPWHLFAAYLAAKYLFMHGLQMEELLRRNNKRKTPASSPPARLDWKSRLYHLPANADVRAHLLAAAMLLGAPMVELGFFAAYYGLRGAWRFVLAPRRLDQVAAPPAERPRKRKLRKTGRRATHANATLASESRDNATRATRPVVVVTSEES